MGDSNNSTGQSVIPVDTRNWGPIEDDDVETINLPDGRNWVQVKRYITGADEDASIRAALAAGVTIKNAGANGNRAARRAAGASSTTTETEQTYHFDSAAQTAVLLQRMIRNWSFKDRNGNPTPITAKSIGSLPVFARDFIMARIDEMNPKADIPDEDDEEELDQHGNNTGPLDEPTNDS